MKVIALIRENKLIIEIDAEYLENAAEMGLTTNNTGKVTNRMDMLQHFAVEFERIEDDSNFGRFIDNIIDHAIQDGETWID